MNTPNTSDISTGKISASNIGTLIEGVEGKVGEFIIHPKTKRDREVGEGDK